MFEGLPLWMKLAFYGTAPLWYPPTWLYSKFDDWRMARRRQREAER